MSFIDEQKLEEIRKKTKEEVRKKVEIENNTIDTERWAKIQQRAAALGEFEEAEFYRARENREPDPYMSNYQLDEMMLDSMERSAKFSTKSKSNITMINVEKLSNIHYTKTVDLLPHEIIFLNYISNKKINKYNPKDCNIAGYWTHNHKIEIMPTLEKLFEGGYLTFKDIYSNISNASVDELKTYLKKHSLSVSGKKQDLATRIYNSASESELYDSFPIYSFNITDIGQQLIIENSAYIIWQEMNNILPITLEDIASEKKYYPKLMGADLVIKTVQDKIDYLLCNRKYGSARNAYFALAEIEYRYSSKQNAEIYYLFCAVYDELENHNTIAPALKTKLYNMDITDNIISSCITLINKFNITESTDNLYSIITSILNKVSI